MSDEEYVTLSGLLMKRTVKAVLLEIDGKEGWVARSCCRFSTDQDVDQMDLGDEGQFQVMRWVAEKAGFL